jgi:thiol-disulfide isomerase/thioredoxin
VPETSRGTRRRADTGLSGLRAPELTGRGWLNTGGRPLSLADLRGKIVILDFWTFCCINCLHVIDELRPLEEKYADVLVVVGVHSPKFVHEADPDALAAAVERYDVHHPVLDDPQLSTWQAYTARAWPTLVVVDPEGYIAASMSGEGHGHGLDSLIAELVEQHARKGTLRHGSAPYKPPQHVATELRFPGKVIELPSGELLVTDAAHHSLAVMDRDLARVMRRIGTGERGLVDGPEEKAQFSEPQGLCLLPADVARAVGYDVVIADTVNHALRGLTLSTGEVRTIAGTGRQWWQDSPRSGPARAIDLSSPWDVAWYDGRVVIAMAGIHQLWWYDVRTETVAVLAGTSNEGLRDGPAGDAWMAQPSGLAASADGLTLWIADSEISALRRLREGALSTVVGRGLFDFGLRDGDAGQALFQHPLGVCVLPDDTVAVLDTYNNAVRRYDPGTVLVSTMATGIAEPSGAAVAGDRLVVVESAAHRLTTPPLGAAAVPADTAHRTQRRPTSLAPGQVWLRVPFTPPTGQKLDNRYGPATRLVVSASPPDLLAAGAGEGAELSRRLVLSGTVPDGVLHVSAMAASCDEEGDFPACHVHQQDWGVPVKILTSGENQLTLALRAV